MKVKRNNNKEREYKPLTLSRFVHTTNKTGDIHSGFVCCVNLRRKDVYKRQILEKGVIDFEFCSIAPLGLDVFTACGMESFWMFKNENGKIHAKFSFDEDNLDYLVEVLNKICSNYNLNMLLEYQNDFILFKAFWSTAHERHQAIKSGNETKWKFRRIVLMYCIEKYLKDEKINPLDFQGLAQI